MLNFVFFYLGFFAILTQLIVFRELSVLFYGSEFFLGTYLASWLFWVGLGSLLAGRLAGAGRPPERVFSSCFIALAALLPLTIFLIRISKSVFRFGEFIGPLTTVFFTFIVMGLLCFPIGCQFSLACARAGSSGTRQDPVGRVYLLEALGSVTGGVLFTYGLIGHVATLLMAAGLSWGSVLAAWGLGCGKMSVKSAAAMMAILVSLPVCVVLEPAVNRIQWKGYRFLQQEETPHATLALVKMGTIRNIFADGMVSASFPDPESYEPVVHWPLLAAPARPRRVLVLGDFSLGAIKEVFKHDPESVDYVVLDHALLALIGPYLDVDDAAALKDPRLRIHYGDARLFVKRQPGPYEAVIIDIPEVPNLKVNRFFTEEFYEQLSSLLAPGGVLGVSIASSENYLDKQTRMFNASVYRTLSAVFRAVEVVPGDTLMLLAATTALDMRRETLLERFRLRKLNNRALIPSVIDHKLDAYRRSSLKRLLEETPGIEINKDFRPTAYYYFISFWLSKFPSAPEYVSGAALLALAFYWIRRQKPSFSFFIRNKECVLIFVLGFVSISLEVELLLSFQILSGYVYWQMGMLFASFMSGLFSGAVWATRLTKAPGSNRFSRHRAPPAGFSNTTFLVLSSLVLIALTVGSGYLLSPMSYLPTSPLIVVFVLLLMANGATVGSSFVIASFQIQEGGIMRRAGNLYAADLWGSASGALLSTHVLIPLFGLLGVLNFSAAVGAAGLAWFLIHSGKTGRP